MLFIPTSDDVRLKCTIKLEGDNKSCREEKKKCLEIINGATEEICSNATTSEENRICILDTRTLCCNETINEAIKEENNITSDSFDIYRPLINEGKYNSLFSLFLNLFIIPLIFLC